MKKYSFILPIYKVEKYLEECIKSILNQTMNNYEIILVDDGSPDNCPKICDEYKNKYSCIKVVHKKNGGLCDARNAGLEVAEGEYILFLDPDDYIENNYLEVIDKEIKDYDFLVFGFRNIYKNKTTKGFSINKELTKDETVEFMLADDKYCGYVWNKVYKHDIIKKFNLVFDTEVTMSEDILFSYQYIEHAKSFKAIDNVLINYRQRKSSIISKKIKEIEASTVVKTYIYILSKTKNENVKIKIETLYMKAYYKYRKYIRHGDFDHILLEKIKKEDYSKFTSRDKKIIFMYKYFPKYRTITYKVRDLLNKKFD